jgi:hypothetical protein
MSNSIEITTHSIPTPMITLGTCCSHIREPTLNALPKSRPVPSSVSLFAIVFLPYDDQLKDPVHTIMGYNYNRSVRSYRTPENLVQSFKSSRMLHRVDLSVAAIGSEEIAASIFTV